MFVAVPPHVCSGSSNGLNAVAMSNPHALVFLLEVTHPQQMVHILNFSAIDQFLCERAKKSCQHNGPVGCAGVKSYRAYGGGRSYEPKSFNPTLEVGASYHLLPSQSFMFAGGDRHVRHQKLSVSVFLCVIFQWQLSVEAVRSRLDHIDAPPAIGERDVTGSRARCPRNRFLVQESSGVSKDFPNHFCARLPILMQAVDTKQFG